MRSLTKKMIPLSTAFLMMAGCTSKPVGPGLNPEPIAMNLVDTYATYDTGHYDCKIWVSLDTDYHDITFSSWSGECPNGYAEGVGKAVFSYMDDGVRQTMTHYAPFTNGHANGVGVFEDKHLVYRGGFKDTLFSGYGKAALKDGDSIEGVWENGVPNGNTKIHDAEDNVDIVGQMVNGYWHGNVETYSSSGAVINSVEYNYGAMISDYGSQNKGWDLLSKFGKAVGDTLLVLGPAVGEVARTMHNAPAYVPGTPSAPAIISTPKPLYEPPSGQAYQSPSVTRVDPPNVMTIEPGGYKPPVVPEPVIEEPKHTKTRTYLHSSGVASVRCLTPMMGQGWQNSCDVGISVTWSDSNLCSNFRCSNYVEPNGATLDHSTLEGFALWYECKSPGGQGDVTALVEHGFGYCYDP